MNLTQWSSTDMKKSDPGIYSLTQQVEDLCILTHQDSDNLGGFVYFFLVKVHRSIFS